MTNAQGQNFATITLQDTGSGIDHILVTYKFNVNVVVPSFTPGTTAPVVVTGTAINNADIIRFVVQAFDVAGNMTECDPIVAVEVRDTGQPMTQTFSVPQSESKITVKNNSPGLKNLTITVNGVDFSVSGLGDNEVRHIDATSAMKAGDLNSVTLSAHGKPGGSATVTIADGFTAPVVPPASGTTAPAASITPTPSPSAGTPGTSTGPAAGSGDVDGNGRFSLSDVIMLLKSVVGGMTLSPEQRAAADLNGDGKADLRDAILLLERLVGL